MTNNSVNLSRNIIILKPGKMWTNPFIIHAKPQEEANEIFCVITTTDNAILSCFKSIQAALGSKGVMTPIFSGIRIRA